MSFMTDFVQFEQEAYALKAAFARAASSLRTVEKTASVVIPGGSTYFNFEVKATGLGDDALSMMTINPHNGMRNFASIRRRIEGSSRIWNVQIMADSPVTNIEVTVTATDEFNVTATLRENS